MAATINDLLLWYKASGIQDAIITVPLVELVLLFMLLTVCLLLRLTRTGLIVTYLFIYRWGWLFCLHNNFRDHQMSNLFVTGYIVFGILVLTLTVIAMTISARSSGE